MLIATRSGDGLTTLEHRAAPVFTMLHPAGEIAPRQAATGELVRLGSRRGPLEMTVTVRRLTLPAYRAASAASSRSTPTATRARSPRAARLPPSAATARPASTTRPATSSATGRHAEPPPTGIDIFVVPEDGGREGVILRQRQTNPPRPLGEPESDLVKATRKAFRSFRFGLDRP